MWAARLPAAPRRGTARHGAELDVRLRASDWPDAHLTAGAPAALSVCHYCCSDSQPREHRWAPSVRFYLRRWCYLKTRVMDATIYQIIFGELGDINCSLMDAFQDTFLENTSLSLLNTDGKVEVFLPSFLFFWLNTSWIRRMNVFFPPPGFYCNATTDEIGTCWPRSSAGRIVERPCPEYINGVKYNTTSKNWNSNKSFNVGGRQVPKHSFSNKKNLDL